MKSGRKYCFESILILYFYAYKNKAVSSITKSDKRI